MGNPYRKGLLPWGGRTRTEQIRRYEVLGETVGIPLCWNQHTPTYVEDYNKVIEPSLHTPSGRPILLTLADACPCTGMGDDGPASIDCGSCPHNHQFPGSLLGACENEKRRSPGKARETGNEEEILPSSTPSGRKGENLTMAAVAAEEGSPPVTASPWKTASTAK